MHTYRFVAITILIFMHICVFLWVANPTGNSFLAQYDFAPGVSSVELLADGLHFSITNQCSFICIFMSFMYFVLISFMRINMPLHTVVD